MRGEEFLVEIVEEIGLECLLIAFLEVFNGGGQHFRLPALFDNLPERLGEVCRALRFRAVQPGDFLAELLNAFFGRLELRYAGIACRTLAPDLGVLDLLIALVQNRQRLGQPFD